MQLRSCEHLKLADWVKNNPPSVMEELLAGSSKEQWISLALGLPAAALFPTHFIEEAFEDVLALNHSVFQYQPPLEELKSHVKHIMALRGVQCHEDQILLTAGAQQGISLITRLLLEAQSRVALEKLAYPGLLQALKPFTPDILTINTHMKTGIDLDEVETAFKRKRPAFLYLVADGGNPHSLTLNDEQRKKLAYLAAEYEVPIIEDDPYGFLNYQQPRSPIKKYADDWVFYIGSFSKLLAPALRVGWIVAPQCTMRHLSSLKECSDINTASFNHHLVNALLNKNIFESQIQTLRNYYAKQRDCLVNSLTQYLASDITFSIPECGFFIWAYFLEKINTSRLLQESLKQNVVFVPSEAFAVTPDSTIYNGMRLNFSYPSEYEIEEGIKRLSLSLQALIKE
ncbi:aminotransferase-like domain-containing protein [Legionella quinlivanii]|uniref:aminotransferase-like domain-containing protein n=1 Tax=Legionella quinlivanii TaxID=45073 RepID=UPI002243AA7D|nr:PLP-dependent aminotransferase family protein [Legionella quinlivanii]MCW8449771.1 PLP-dependent aminotransferase family protein [Legionella quinlivanii]